MKRRVVITGTGIISPIGVGTGTFWQNCLEGKSSIAPVPRRWQEYGTLSSTMYAPLPEIDFGAYGISRTEKMQLDMGSLLALGAAREALQNAGFTFIPRDVKKNTFEIEDIDPVRTGVFMGTGVGGINSLIRNVSNHTFSPIKKDFLTIKEKLGEKNLLEDFEAVVQSLESKFIMPMRFNPFVVSMIMPNACAANIGIKYSVKGANRTITSACAAGTAAVGNAYEQIKLGNFDMMIAGGVEYLNEPFGGIFRGFDIAGTLTRGEHPETANRPFDRDRTGFLYAEGGSAVLILEEAETAKKRGAKIIAEIEGFAETFDGHNIMIMAPDGERIKDMLHMCLGQAGYKPGDIDYINAHATGTKVNDEAEAGVIDEIFGAKPLVNTTKSLTGHTIGASGALEAAVTALSIYHKTTHVCKNLDNPVRDLNFVLKAGSYPIRRAISQSFAFGGHNTSLLFSEYCD